MFCSKSQIISKAIGNQLQIKQSTVSCAESCTGGWISKIFTDTIGSSMWFECGFVTYSYKAKQKILGINYKLLQEYGAVSEIIVSEMALKAQCKSGSSYSIAVSGIAGPSGSNLNNPIGTVWFGFATPEKKVLTYHHKFNGNRNIIRSQSVYWALQIFYNEFLLN
ncbi:nicotinamide-nucleotide amidohydrolase family protein [Candidatus Pantoea edessiphila]|uniref:CinA C-terminal domain-containing protein n=1 Tax=Candidatus Pantoea edessiphila TaxID=2044610 RepID=A0A2P5SVP0_9GAMM|nr:nicotinamide-nucleotide amidohydrolase family protein [Candidatus Pantoea edessiphila]PPI86382.1 hypothetical protein CRV10_02800 [Candidatus Pantoea edessiphila]